MPRFSTVVGVCFLLALMAVSVGAQVVDAALDAKRKAGVQFLRDGRLTEAVAILAEVAGSPHADYRDHLAHARALDRVNRPREAAEAYRKVIAMVSDSVRDTDAKSARAEAERRLKSLDPVWDRVRQARERFLKEIDGLEREAELARSDAALEQIMQLRSAMMRIDPNPNMLYFTLSMKTPKGWLSTGFNIVAGQTYRCRARGTWHTGNGPGVECNANGLPNKRNLFGTIGQLYGCVDGRPPYINLGVDVEFKAPVSGILQLGGNQDENLRPLSSGSLFVVIEKKD